MPAATMEFKYLHAANANVSLSLSVSASTSIVAWGLINKYLQPQTNTQIAHTMGQLFILRAGVRLKIKIH